jgi:type II secretory pathway pseudopilin PulG
MRMAAMDSRTRKPVGLTLIEMTLVVATIALLLGLALPAVRAMIDSFQSEGGTKSIIQAALNSARVMAMTHQRYVGVRFQKACTSNDPCDPLKGDLNAPQYMIFIVQDEPKNMGGLGDLGDPRNLANLGNGFRAMEGHEPIRLPDTTGVMQEDDMNPIVAVGLKREGSLSDMTTFSIVFSPSGKLIVHEIRVRNRDGVYRPDNAPGSTKASYDDVFNSAENICLYKRGMFIQDDYSWLNPTPRAPRERPELGLGWEDSVTSFFFYDVATLRTLYTKLRRPDGDVIDYLDAQKRDRSVYVNSYTGDLISPG